MATTVCVQTKKDKAIYVDATIAAAPYDRSAETGKQDSCCSASRRIRAAPSETSRSNSQDGRGVVSSRGRNPFGLLCDPGDYLVAGSVGRRQYRRSGFDGT